MSGGRQHGEEILRTENLVKSYRKRRVVDNVNIQVHKGQIVGLLGPNGAGKTTSFRIVVGMIKPDSGRVLFGNQDISRMPMYRRARRGIGYLSQERSLFRSMSCFDNIVAVLEARGVPRKERRTRAEELLDELQLLHLRDNRADTLSGGEGRRLEISRALATQPNMLLLDEPFAAVDPVTTEEIQKVLDDLADRGIAILITDHDATSLLQLAHHAYVLAEGAVIAEGPPQKIIRNEKVRQVYLGSKFGEGISEEEGRELDL